MSSRQTDRPVRRILMSAWECEPNIVGGMGRHVTELVQAMGEGSVSGNYEVHLLTPAVCNVPSYEQLGQWTHIHRFPWPGQAEGNIYDDSIDLVGHTLALNRLLTAKAFEVVKHHPIDLIHAHDWLAAPSAMELSRTWKVPLISTFHATEKGRHYGHIVNEMNRRIDEMEAALCRTSERVIVCSQYMRDNLVESFQRPSEQFVIIPNGVNGQSLTVVRESGFSLDFQRLENQREVHLLFIGRPDHCKGLHVLLDAMPLILDTHPQVHLVVAGRDSLELQTEVASRGLADNVSLLGYVADAQRNGLLQAADAAVMPSLYEPFGIVALEAMAAGCPVIVSNIGGLAEVVDHGETGLTVTPDDPQSITWAVDQLLTYPELTQNRASAAKKKVAKHFRWDRISRLTQEVYETALTRNHRQENY